MSNQGGEHKWLLSPSYCRYSIFPSKRLEWVLQSPREDLLHGMSGEHASNTSIRTLECLLQQEACFGSRLPAYRRCDHSPWSCLLWSCPKTWVTYYSGHNRRGPIRHPLTVRGSLPISSGPDCSSQVVDVTPFSLPSKRHISTSR